MHTCKSVNVVQLEQEGLRRLRLCSVWPGPGQPCACRLADSPPYSLLGLALLGAELQPDVWEWVDVSSLLHPVLCPAFASLPLISFWLLTWGARHSCGCRDGSATPIQLLALGLPLRYAHIYWSLWELIQTRGHSRSQSSVSGIQHLTDLSLLPSCFPDPVFYLSTDVIWHLLVN